MALVGLPRTIALPRVMRRFSSVPDDHYDLRAAGGGDPEPFEVNGEPTDITKTLAKGGKQIGYTSKYARSWDRIFGDAKGQGSGAQKAHSDVAE
jgi:hypothetical protein